jgi:hypothetical protein
MEYVERWFPQILIAGVIIVSAVGIAAVMVL